MGEKRRTNNIFIIGLAVSVLAVTGGALVFSTPEIRQLSGNHHRNSLIPPATSSPNQPVSLDGWVAYQHVDLPLKYMYPRNWVHEEAVLKGIGPKTFQVYPADYSPPAIIYVAFLDDQPYTTLDEVQSVQQQVRRFHGSFARISLNGVEALDESFAGSHRGEPWVSRTVSVLYNGTIIEFTLQVEYEASAEAELTALAIFDRLLNSVRFSETKPE